MNLVPPFQPCAPNTSTLTWLANVANVCLRQKNDELERRLKEAEAQLDHHDKRSRDLVAWMAWWQQNLFDEIAKLKQENTKLRLQIKSYMDSTGSEEEDEYVPSLDEQIDELIAEEGAKSMKRWST